MIFVEAILSMGIVQTAQALVVLFVGVPLALLFAVYLVYIIAMSASELLKRR